VKKDMNEKTGKIEVIGKTIIATEEALSKTCPARPKWLGGIIANLGIEITLQSPKLRKMALCPEVLEIAGYSLKVVPAEEFEKTVEELSKNQK